MFLIVFYQYISKLHWDLLKQGKRYIYFKNMDMTCPCLAMWILDIKNKKKY